MDKIIPLWLPNEKECLLSILENLIYEGLLATREKLGLSTVCLVDTNFWMNIGLEFDRLCHEADIMAIITDFIPYFWLQDDVSRTFVSSTALPIPSHEATEKLVNSWDAEWREDGNVVFVGMITPQIAQFVKARRDRITRVIALLGPNLHHVCTAWELQPEQYKVLVSRDTLDVLDPHVRWNMIYGSKML